jgi:polyhydroxyalkanoate synthase
VAPIGYTSPEQWLEQAEHTEGSWWPHWQQWLARHSDRQRVAPPAMGLGRTLGPAPGRFVVQP